MPYEKSGIIKVPERIARSSACIAVLYLQVCTEVGHKTYCSTVRGLIYTQVTGRAQCHNYRCGGGVVKGHMHRGVGRGHRKPARLSTTRMKRTRNRTRQNKVTAEFNYAVPPPPPTPTEAPVCPLLDTLDQLIIASKALPLQSERSRRIKCWMAAYLQQVC